MMMNMMILNQKRTIAITGKDKVDKLFHDGRKLHFHIKWIVLPLFVAKLYTSNIIYFLFAFFLKYDSNKKLASPPQKKNTLHCQSNHKVDSLTDV